MVPFSFRHRVIALAVGCAVLPVLARAQSAPAATRAWPVALTPSFLLAQSGPQAAPPELGVPGTMQGGAGLSATVGIARLPLALSVGFSSHGHTAEPALLTLTGNTKFVRSALVYRTAATRRLRGEIGAGVLYGKSTTTIALVGEQIGLKGVGARVDVNEVAPMGTVAANLRLFRGTRAQVDLRAGVDYAATESKGTLLFPIGLQIAR